MEIQDYSEKSIVVFGEKTKENKDGLRELGGKFNMRLSVGPGWIFPKTERERVEKFVAEGVVEKKTFSKSDVVMKKTYVTAEAKKDDMKMNDCEDPMVLIRLVNSKIDRLLAEVDELKALKKLLGEFSIEKEEKKVEKKVIEKKKEVIKKPLYTSKKKVESSDDEVQVDYDKICFEDELEDDEKPIKKLL